MKISKIKISGFKSIDKEIEIDFSSQISALIGPNNAGKSNILTAIYKVLGRDWITVNNFDESDVFIKDPERDITIEVKFDHPFQYRQYVGMDPIPIPKIKFVYTKYKVGENKGQRRLEKSCPTLDDKNVQILARRPQKGQQRQYKPLTTIPQDLQESFPIIYIGVDRQLKNQLPYARNSLLGTLLKDIDDDFSRPDNTINIKNKDGTDIEISRTERFNQCVKESIRVLRTDEFIKLEKSIKENALTQLGFDVSADGDTIDVYFNPLTSLDFYKSLQIWVKENDFEIKATELGGGFQNALVIAILKAFEERRKQGALFLIEEPEMYLHPQMQRSLYKTMREIAKTNQVIYVTHSPHFVTVPEFDEVILVQKDKQKSTIVVQSSIEPDPRLKDKLRKELDPERNELFFARRILFVEGDTEKLALPEYAMKLRIDFDKAGASIIEVGGKRNLKDFIDIALSFQIPVGFVYDIDSSDFSGRRDEEAEYNKMLESYKETGVEVWSLDKNYEQELRKFYGDSKYQEVCQQHNKVTKAVRARLIANDSDLDMPGFVVPIIKWLGNKVDSEVD